MKKNDLAALILIASVSLLFAWFTESDLIGEPKKESRKVKTIEVNSDEVKSPDTRIFNGQAINPTVERSIGKSSDSLPFD